LPQEQLPIQPYAIERDSPLLQYPCAETASIVWPSLGRPPFQQCEPLQYANSLLFLQ